MNRVRKPKWSKSVVNKTIKAKNVSVTGQS